MLQVPIAPHELSPVITYALRGNGGAAVIFTNVATVVANGSEANELYGTVLPALHFGVRGPEVLVHHLRGADRNQNVVIPNHTDTSTATERSWLLIPGTTGDRIVKL